MLRQLPLNGTGASRDDCLKKKESMFCFWKGINIHCWNTGDTPPFSVLSRDHTREARTLTVQTFVVDFKLIKMSLCNIKITSF